MRLVQVLTLVLLVCAKRAFGLGMWDAMPAFEPTHLAGAFVGRRICPMCSHGYDSGILVFVPASWSVDKAHALAGHIAPSQLGISSERFRVFVIVTGQASRKLVDALNVNDSRWFIAELQGAALTHAERTMRESLRDAVGFIFAERRMLWRVVESDMIRGEAADVKAHAHFAARTIAQGRGREQRERVLEQCENCGIVYQERPELFSAESLIAPENEPGERLVVRGIVFDARGKPAPDVVVFAYHTNREGQYEIENRGTPQAHFRLRGWVRTNAQGEYSFRTIRPGAYPNRAVPAHIHMHVVEPGRCTYFISDVEFSDDSKTHIMAAQPRGGVGLLTPTRDDFGVWHATRDIYLGRNINNYAKCGDPG